MKKVVAAVLFGVLSIAGCADQQAVDEPTTSSESYELTTYSACGCDAVLPTVWNREIQPSWPRGASNMMVMLTGSGDPYNDKIFYAFGVANGSFVAWVYQVNKEDYASFQASLNLTFTQMESLNSRLWWGGGGTLGTGGPGPIGPGGIPPVYINRIVRSAGTLVDSTRAMLDFRAPTTTTTTDSTGGQ